MVKSFKTNILTWLKTKMYVKDEIDTKLSNKANTDHSHTSGDIEIDEGGEDYEWLYEYGRSRQSSINVFVYEHEKKLENIDNGANKTVVDSSLSSSSTNPVQNKVIKGALDGKANVQHNHTVATVVNLQSTLNSKSDVGHTHDDRYYTETEMNTKLNNKANSTHTHNISDVSSLSTSLGGKMGNNYKVSAVTGADNMYAHRIGDIVILSWWGRGVSTTNNWQDWKTLPYTSANTQHIWTSVQSTDTSVRVRIPPKSDKLQINVSGNGNIGAGFIVYPTK